MKCNPPLKSFLSLIFTLVVSKSKPTSVAPSVSFDAKMAMIPNIIIPMQNIPQKPNIIAFKS